MTRLPKLSPVPPGTEAGSGSVQTFASWVEVSVSALRHNLQAIQSRVGPNVTICPVIKSDAYGHGATSCALALCDAGAKWLAVSSVDEGIALRRLGVEAR